MIAIIVQYYLSLGFSQDWSFVFGAWLWNITLSYFLAFLWRMVAHSCVNDIIMDFDSNRSD